MLQLRVKTLPMDYSINELEEGDLADAPQMCEVELYLHPQMMFKQEQIRHSDDAANILRACFHSGHISLREEFKALYLNRANYVIGYCTHSIGSTDGTVVDIKQIMATAIKTMSSGVLLCHNHPSGNAKPSDQDLRLTKQFKQAAEFFNIQLLDHIILTPEGYYSMADELDL